MQSQHLPTTATVGGGLLQTPAVTDGRLAGGDLSREEEIATEDHNEKARKQPFDFLIILDFEATCLEHGRISPQEVIEFPSVILDIRHPRHVKIVDTFESFVRPVHHPILTEFCTSLTSITQDDVDQAETFEQVFKRHQLWLAAHELLMSDRAVFVTCGDWDLKTCFPCQIKCSHISSYPSIYSRWINIKVTFHKSQGVAPRGMQSLLDFFRLTLDGTHHRGIDDCRNIAKIAIQLLRRGALFETTGVAGAGGTNALWQRKKKQ